MATAADLRPTRYPVPAAALDDRLGFIGTAGSGKTYNAGVGVEKLLGTGARVVIVDPLSVWWGLRLLADGKSPGFDVAIFGGPHGDLALNEHAGPLIGETAATMAESCIIDLSELGSKAADRRFMCAFLETIYRKADGRPFHLVVDEADLFAPQRPQRGDEVLLGHMENIVRRGRVKGFIPWLISQRPAVLNKNVLSQVDGLVAFKLTASQDRDALDAWIEGQADRAEGKAIKDSLPAMAIGQGVVWIPGRSILTTAVFPSKVTFDSSRTPKRGERQERRDLKPLDVGALKQRLASVEAEAKANDPKVLKAEIARLTRELNKAKSGRASQPDSRELSDLREQLRAAEHERDMEILRAEKAEARVAAALTALQAETGHAPKPRESRHIPAPTPLESRAKPAAQPRADGPRPNGALSGPQQRVLNALAWWAAFGIDRPTSEQVAFVSGYSPSSSGYTNLKGALRSSGLVDYPLPGCISLTDDGRALSSAPDTSPTQAAFHAAVRAKLKPAQLRLLDPLMAIYPDQMSSNDLAVAASYSPTSSGFTNLRGNMRSLGFLDYPSAGQVRAADWLFPRPPRAGLLDLSESKGPDHDRDDRG